MKLVNKFLSLIHFSNLFSCAIVVVTFHDACWWKKLIGGTHKLNVVQDVSEDIDKVTPVSVIQ